MKEYWAKVKKTYGLANDLEEIIRNYAAQTVKDFLENNQSVLDLGCGNGKILNKIATNNKNLRLTGVDYSKEMLEEASEIRYPDLKLFHSDIFGFIKNFDIGSYNFIFSLNTLHNLNSREGIRMFLEKISRASSPGTFLMFDVRNMFNPFVSLGYRKSRRQGYDFFTFSYLRALNILKSNGYQILKVKAIRYDSLKHANKENLSYLKRVLYRIYLKLSQWLPFSPYILIFAQKKREKFIDIIWGYHSQLSKLSPIENYHLHDLGIAKLLGYQTEILSINASYNIEDDPNFDKNTKVTKYTSVLAYLKFLFKNRKAVIYANTFTWQSFLAPLFSRKVIFMGHDSVKRKTMTKQLIQDFVFRFFYKIRVVTQAEKDFLVKRGISPNKIFVIPLALDIDRFLVKNNLERKNIAFLGNVTPDKNIKDILLALSRLVVEFPQIKLEIFGEVRDENFEKLVLELNLKNNIVMHGFVPHSLLCKHLSRTMIYVNSSISEGQCLAAYEAALAGNVLCLPNTLSFSSVFKDFAFFHELFNPEQLALNITACIKNSEKRSSLISYGQKYISENYNDPKITLEIKKIFS